MKGMRPDTHPIFCDKEDGLSSEDSFKSYSPESELVGGSPWVPQIKSAEFSALLASFKLSRANLSPAQTSVAFCLPRLYSEITRQRGFDTATSSVRQESLQQVKLGLATAIKWLQAHSKSRVRMPRKFCRITTLGQIQA